jgi:hypothetical protein
VEVEVLKACSDGNQTVVQIQTTLDSHYWKLNASDFEPVRGVDFETGTVLLETGVLFSSTSSGERSPVEFNPLNQVARVLQTQTYPQVPSPNAQFLLKAEVTLLNLPPTYLPPDSDTPIAFADPGIIVVPIQFQLPVEIVTCR